MELTFFPLTLDAIDQAAAESLCLFVGADERPLTGLAGLVDWRLLARLSRLLRGATIWEAHREHFYQKLVQLGFGHRGTLMLYGALMLGIAASALLALVRAPSSGPALLALWNTVMALLFGAIGHYWHTKGKALDESKH